MKYPISPLGLVHGPDEGIKPIHPPEALSGWEQSIWRNVGWQAQGLKAERMQIGSIFSP